MDKYNKFQGKKERSHSFEYRPESEFSVSNSSFSISFRNMNKETGLTSCLVNDGIGDIVCT